MVASAKKTSSSKGKPSAAKADDANIENAVSNKNEASDAGSAAPDDTKKAEENQPEPEKAEPEKTEGGEMASGPDDGAVRDKPETGTVSADAVDTPETEPEDASDDAHVMADDTPVDPFAQVDAPGADAPEAEAIGTQTKAAASEASTAEAVHPVPVPAQVTPRNNTFLPLVLGGIIAGILGFMAAELDVFSRDDTAANAALSEAVDSQQERIAALENAPAPEPAPAPAAEPSEPVDLAPIEERLDTLESRIATLEDRPAPTTEDGPDSDAAAQYAEELSALQSSVETQRNEIQTLLEDARNAEAASAEAARIANAQAAITKIVSAIDAGQPFAAPVETLQSLDVGDVPSALTENAGDGVVTLNMLQAQFPDAARSALSAARAAGAADGEQGFSSFLKRQLGARSVAPREGSDPDAILSRAEAALLNGNLDDTLTVLDALPEQAGSALADWREAARSRVAARTAADELAQRLTAD